MGNLCTRDDASSGDMVESLEHGNALGGSDEDVSQKGYHSRRSSMQLPFVARDKYLNESEEDRKVRMCVFEACMSARVKAVQDVIAEHGEYCLDLRSTSMLDDKTIEPLLGNVSKYRKARPGGSACGIVNGAQHPMDGQTALDRSLGLHRGGAATSTRQRRTLPPSAHKIVAPLPSFRPSEPPPALDATAVQSAQIPHTVEEAEESSIVDKSTIGLAIFSPIKPSLPVATVGGETNEVSLALPRELEAAAANQLPDAGGGLSQYQQGITRSTSLQSVGSQPLSPLANSNGSPMIWSASVGSRELISFLLLCGQDLNEVVHRTTALIVAIRNAQSAELVRFMLSRGAKAHLGRGQIDSQALHYAVEVGDASVVRILLEEKAVSNWLSRDGCTGLHIAVRKGFTDIVKLLVSHGADPSIRETRTNQDCFEIAASMNFADISTFLKHHKRINPTQYGVASLNKPNGGMINGMLESQMSKSARASASVRPQAIRQYLSDGPTAVTPSLSDGAASGTQGPCRLNPALSRSAALIGVPANPVVQNLSIDRCKPRKVNRNNLTDALEASANNPPPASDAVGDTQRGPSHEPPGWEILGITIESDKDAKTPVDDDVVSRSSVGVDRSAKALFNQHGWSEKTFHTNMSRKRPQLTIAVAAE